MHNYIILLVSTFFFYGSVNSQIPYKETNFRAPLNIPLVLAGNFAELRSNHFHTGLDIKTNHKEGYRIYSIEDGYISRINISHWGYGKAIYVTHPNGYTSVYAHLSGFPKNIETYLRKKQFESETETININLASTDIIVKKGDIIAFSGNTGSSSAPHLHFEIRETLSENPVNPLLFNFEIKDNVKPDIYNLKIYPINGSINHKTETQLFDVTGNNGTYALKDNPTIILNGEIGFGIHTIDKLDAAGNKCGIYTIELEFEGKTVFKQTMEKLDFSTNRYINAHKDYEEYHNKRKSIHKSFKTENNDLLIYSDLENNGIISFNKDTTYHLKYIIRDTYGNTSTLAFEVQGTTNKTIFPNKKHNATPLDKFELKKDDFEAILEEKTLYEKTMIDYNTEKTFYSSAELHKIGNSDVPLQKYFVMKIKTQGIPQDKTNKAVLVNISDNKRQAYAKGGTFKDGWVEAKVRELGYYTVKVDSTAPVVTPINISNNKNIGEQATIQFKISDNLSGIDTYRIYIDKEFKLANYVPRSGTLTLNFDEYNTIAKGAHHLKIVVTDERGNLTVQDYDFIK